MRLIGLIGYRLEQIFALPKHCDDRAQPLIHLAPHAYDANSWYSSIVTGLKCCPFKRHVESGA